MITLRQHAISLAAVFLALAVGVVLGSGLLNDTLLSGLRDDKRTQQRQIEDLNQDKNALGEKLNAASNFDATMAPRMVKDALGDRKVVLFTTPEADRSDVDGIAQLISTAGGSVSGRVGLTDQFTDANQGERLRTIVNSSILPAGTQLRTDAVDQGSQAGDLVGIVLQIAPHKPEEPAPPVTDEQRDIALSALRQSGFISYTDGQVSAGNLAVIVTGGALPDDAGNKGSSVARFAAALDRRGSGTVLVGRSGSANGIASIAVTRADGSMASAASTVDDVEMSSGRITTILALREQSDGHSGRYGLGPGATSITVP
ncbi:copper transporter [Mycobacteroides salmoniphilum]|uniref:Copper transporter MctB n=1 Tax=Mycobacteroides salmoniphilum TaxID=404941 RepID=A0A4R8SAW0_9MYCO|nr:copper transporter [Mycobacteroides salmoniphilum]TDZ91612.1 Copper transporter MctB precursor [Mycobacteroides salmoniphilum]TEA08866.1 Copper transporter MctB precursor [Mycobacteroides salmoniphilum]